MKQIDIKNFMAHTQPLDSNIFRVGNDIHLSLRFEGDFYESMELQVTAAAFERDLPHACLPRMCY